MISNSASLLASRLHIASAVSSLWSKQAIFVFSQDRLDDLGDMAILLNGVFGFRPNCASNGDFFVVTFGVILEALMSSALSEASLYGFSIMGFHNRESRFKRPYHSFHHAYRAVIVHWCKCKC